MTVLDVSEADFDVEVIQCSATTPVVAFGVETVGVPATGTSIEATVTGTTSAVVSGPDNPISWAPSWNAKEPTVARQFLLGLRDCAADARPLRPTYPVSS